MKINYWSIILLLISLPLVYANNAELDDYMPSFWLGESWDDVGQMNMFTRFASNLFTFGSDNLDASGGVDIYNWYNGTPYGLAPWERDVCLLQLSTDVRSFRDSATLTQGSTNTYTTTITATAFRSKYYDSNYYEASWYFMPYDGNALYKAYLTNGIVKEYLAGQEGTEDSTYAKANKIVGASGYSAKELNSSISSLVIEYKYVGSSQVRTFQAKVVDKNG